MEFTINTAIEFARANKLKTWVLLYLKSHGNNLKLAELIKKNKAYFVGPIDFELKKLLRCSGPENEMLYKQDKLKWDIRINNLIDFIKKGHKYPPLIVWFKNNTFSIADGNHRHYAFTKLNYKKYPTIFYFENEEDYNLFLKRI